MSQTLADILPSADTPSHSLTNMMNQWTDFLVPPGYFGGNTPQYMSEDGHDGASSNFNTPSMSLPSHCMVPEQTSFDSVPPIANGSSKLALLASIVTGVEEGNTLPDFDTLMSHLNTSQTIISHLKTANNIEPNDSNSSSSTRSRRSCAPIKHELMEYLNDPAMPMMDDADSDNPYAVLLPHPDQPASSQAATAWEALQHSGKVKSTRKNKRKLDADDLATDSPDSNLLGRRKRERESSPTHVPTASTLRSAGDISIDRQERIEAQVQHFVKSQLTCELDRRANFVIEYPTDITKENRSVLEEMASVSVFVAQRKRQLTYDENGQRIVKRPREVNKFIKNLNELARQRSAHVLWKSIMKRVPVPREYTGCWKITTEKGQYNCLLAYLDFLHKETGNKYRPPPGESMWDVLLRERTEKAKIIKLE